METHNDEVQVRLDGWRTEPIHGVVVVAGEAPEPFTGWLRLMSVLERLRHPEDHPDSTQPRRTS